MTQITPIEQLRRRTPTAHRELPLSDRGVLIPVHREIALPRRDVARARAVRTVVETRGWSESQLAVRFFPLMGAIAVVDLVTKWWATTWLAGRTVAASAPISLALTYNGASAGGVSLGDQTRAINFLATGIVMGLIVMLTPTLASLDRRAWKGLAIVAGAALGNLVSLAMGGAGVVDFIAIHHGHGAWVLNVADVALIVGLGMLARTGLVLFRQVHRGTQRA